MPKKIFLVLLISSLISSAQDVMESMKKTVGFVYGQAHVKAPNGEAILIDGALGTAFFVRYPDPRGGTNYGFTYIVTAKHVLKDDLANKYLDKVRIRLNDKNGEGVGFGTIDVSDSKGNLKWFEDKGDPNADVAIYLAEPNVKSTDYVTIPIENFVDEDLLKKSKVSEGDQVYLVGLMPQFTGEHHNYPVVRHGYIALLSDEPIPLSPTVKEKVYALELGSWQGQSGSPVFLNLSGLRHGGMALSESYHFLGVMLGYFYNQRPFDTVAPTASVWVGDSSNVSISYVLPASEVLKILNSKEAQEQRDADIQALGRKLSH